MVFWNVEWVDLVYLCMDIFWRMWVFFEFVFLGFKLCVNGFRFVE